jgi:hypothetical protein
MPYRLTGGTSKRIHLGDSSPADYATRMRQYLDLVDRIPSTGVETMDRTGTGMLNVFGAQMRFDPAQGFPVLTTRKLHLRSITMAPAPCHFQAHAANGKLIALSV